MRGLHRVGIEHGGRGDCCGGPCCLGMWFRLELFLEGDVGLGWDGRGKHA